MALAAPRHPVAPLTRRELSILLSLLLLGAALLLYRFPGVPAGLHGDEMSEAYESYALLHTGADRWGYHLPVYFLSWGSGQNVLQAYLNIPFVAVLGLTRVSARLLPLLLNLLCLPIFFAAVRRWYGTRPALFALSFLALSPWHIMVSRWGIENSILPFFLALAFWSFRWALDKPAPWRIVLCLLPFDLLLYTYGVMVVVVQLLLILLAWMSISRIRRDKPAWVIAFGLFFLLAAPINWFTIKNNVVKKNLAFEMHLPFSVPLLPASRLDQAYYDLHGRSLLATNITYLDHCLNDTRIGQASWYQLPGLHGIQPVLIALVLVALFTSSKSAVEQHHLSDPFLAALLAFAPLIFILPLNSSRAGFLFLPLIALGAAGMVLVWDWLPSPILRTAFGCLIAILLLSSMFHFTREYYGPKYAAEIAPTFWPTMPEALRSAQDAAGPNMPIYVSDSISLNYCHVLFMDRVDPVLFQHSGATWKNPDFANFRFSRGDLGDLRKPFVFLLTASDADVCSSVSQPQTFGNIRTGICK